MAPKLRTALEKIENLLATSGLFPGGVHISELKKAPGDIAASIFNGNGSIEELRYGAGTLDRREIIIRIYINTILGNIARERRNEFLLDEIWTTLKPLLLADLELALAGIYCVEPTAMTYSCGYVELDQTMFRHMDISIPMLIDDTATVD